MTEAVGELIAVAGRGDDLPRGRSTSRRGTHRQAARPAACDIGDELVDLALPVGGVARTTVRVISEWYPPTGAPKSSLTKSPARRSVAWAGGAGSPSWRRRRRSSQRRRLGPLSQHPGIELRAHLQLCASRPESVSAARSASAWSAAVQARRSRSISSFVLDRRAVPPPPGGPTPVHRCRPTVGRVSETFSSWPARRPSDRALVAEPAHRAGRSPPGRDWRSTTSSTSGSACRPASCTGCRWRAGRRLGA